MKKFSLLLFMCLATLLVPGLNVNATPTMTISEGVATITSSASSGEAFELTPGGEEWESYNACSKVIFSNITSISALPSSATTVTFNNTTVIIGSNMYTVSASDGNADLTVLHSLLSGKECEFESTVTSVDYIDYNLNFSDSQTTVEIVAKSGKTVSLINENDVKFINTHCTTVIFSGNGTFSSFEAFQNAPESKVATTVDFTDAHFSSAEVMTFKHWKTHITTGKGSIYLDTYSNDVIQDCSNLTSLSFGDGTATINRTSDPRTITFTSSSNSIQYSRILSIFNQGGYESFTKLFSAGITSIDMGDYSLNFSGTYNTTNESYPSVTIIAEAGKNVALGSNDANNGTLLYTVKNNCTSIAFRGAGTFTNLEAFNNDPRKQTTIDFSGATFSEGVRKVAYWYGSSSLTTVLYNGAVATVSGNNVTITSSGNATTDNELKAMFTADSKWQEGNITITGASEGSAYDETTQKYTVKGAFNSSTISSINSYDVSKTIKVLDLRYLSLDTDDEEEIAAFKEAFMSLDRSTIEYIILPAGMDKDFVCDKSLYYTTDGGVITETKKSSLSNLKGVISSSSTDLVAYMAEYGNLAEARCLATGNSNAIGFFPTVQGLSRVTLGGKINENDISCKNESGKGLLGENGSIESIDLEKAIYYYERVVTLAAEEGGEPTISYQIDEVDGKIMNFNAAGFEGENTILSEVILPTDPSMKTIPNGGFKNLKSLTSICVPYNYTWIQNDAFLGSSVSHITTTDDNNGAIVDNGPLSYTFSANLKELGEKGVSGTYVFPHDMGVVEIYSLATKVPKCYDHVFPDNINHGYGGQDETKVYCRDRYYNNGEKQKSFAVLRYPSEESYTKSSGEKEESYNLMQRKYTDITKVYTKKDQTGAVDANGDPILWPTREEGERSFNQAEAGVIWDDWETTYTGNGTAINQTTSLTGGEDGTLAEQIGKNTAAHLTPEQFSDYIGWHKIVLTQATYVDPKHEIENKKVVRKYVNAGWFTFCIPFNLTYSQVVEMMGVPKTEGTIVSEEFVPTGDYINRIGDDVIISDRMPDIRQLISVVRTKSSSSNSVNFRLTTNLAKSNSNTAQYYDFGLADPDNDGVQTWEPISHDASDITMTTTSSDEGEESSDEGEDPICLVGGRPYFINAYVREGDLSELQGQYNYNLGSFIMKRYADEFKESASCVNNPEDGFQQIETFTDGGGAKAASGAASVAEENLVTMRFAKPYENHKVQAMGDGAQSGPLMFTGKEGARYFYTMVGQFWEQDLPLYCIYFSPKSQKWFRYAENHNFKWEPYKCVIMATPEVTTKADIEIEIEKSEELTPEEAAAEEEAARTNVINESMGIGVLSEDDEVIIAEKKNNQFRFTSLPSDYVFHYWGGGFRNINHCYFPMNYVGTADLIPAPMKLWFSGRNDYSFENQGNARYIVSLDDNDDIIDYGDNATGVKTIDTHDGVPQINSNTRVYNMSGLYLGTSTDGLPKGVYIVSGRKVVVE